MKLKFLVILNILFLITYWYLRYINHHNIKMFHPCPTLTTSYPILKEIDKWFCVSAGIDWYKVRHLGTNDLYLLKIGNQWNGIENKWEVCYFVMDYKKNRAFKISSIGFIDLYIVKR